MRTWVAPFILAMALAGCQGDSTGNATVSKPGLPEYGGGGKLDPDLPLNKIQGQLVDPYVADALVCLDESDNGVCDTGELTTRSDANGVFTFELGSALSSAAQILVINEGSLQYPHYGRHVGNDFQIALNAKLAAGKNSIIITPAVAAKSVMGTSTTELAAVLNDNFGQYLSVQLTAEDLEVDPFAEMIVTDHARFVEVQKAQQTIAGLLFIFQHINSWDGYYDFVANFVANAATPLTTTSTAADGTVTSTTEEKPLFDLIAAFLKQANANSENVLPTSSANDLLTKANALVETLRADFAASMPSGISYTELPALSNGNKANISAGFAEYFMETLTGNLLAVFSESDDSSSIFSARLKSIVTSIASSLTTQAGRNSAIYAELTSKLYLSSSEVQGVIATYTPTELTLLGSHNQHYSAVVTCVSKRFYLGRSVSVSQTTGAITAVSNGLVCTDDVFSVNDGQELFLSSGDAVDVDIQSMGNLPLGSEKFTKSGCSIKGILKGVSSPTYLATRYNPVYVRNAATGEVFSQLTDLSGGFLFSGLPVPAEVDGFAGYYFGSYSGVRGGYAPYVSSQSFKEIPITCVADQIQSVNVSLLEVADNTSLNGVLDESILGDGVKIRVEQEVTDLIDGDNTLLDDGVDAAWIGETIEDGVSSPHPYMTFDANTGAFNLTHLTEGSYRFNITVGTKPGRGSYQVYSPFFIVQGGQENKITVSVDDATKKVTVTVILTN